MLPVLRTDQAEKDLTEILQYLEDRSPPAADRLATAIDKRCACSQNCLRWADRDDDLAPGLRSLTIKKYVVLFYRVTPTAVEVVRILRSMRDIDNIMKEEKPN